MKSLSKSTAHTSYVAPYVGAWIETAVHGRKILQNQVAPYVGAWIETSTQRTMAILPMSHPTWVRGLKPTSVGLI